MLVICENTCVKTIAKQKKGLKTVQNLNLDSLIENSSNTIFENKNRIQSPNIP